MTLLRALPLVAAVEASATPIDPEVTAAIATAGRTRRNAYIGLVHRDNDPQAAAAIREERARRKAAAFAKRQAT